MTNSVQNWPTWFFAIDYSKSSMWKVVSENDQLNNAQIKNDQIKNDQLKNDRLENE